MDVGRIDKKEVTFEDTLASLVSELGTLYTNAKLTSAFKDDGFDLYQGEKRVFSYDGMRNPLLSFVPSNPPMIHLEFNDNGESYQYDISKIYSDGKCIIRIVRRHSDISGEPVRDDYSSIIESGNNWEYALEDIPEVIKIILSSDFEQSKRRK